MTNSITVRKRITVRHITVRHITVRHITVRLCLALLRYVCSSPVCLFISTHPRPQRLVKTYRFKNRDIFSDLILHHNTKKTLERRAERQRPRAVVYPHSSRDPPETGRFSRTRYHEKA